jgi:hypothetical protein
VIEGIEEGTHSLDVLTRHTGMIAIHKNAFASDEEMDAFIHEVQSHIGKRSDRPAAIDQRIKPQQRNPP